MPYISNPVATTFDLDFDTIAEQFTFTRGSEATFVNEQGLIESTNQLGPELVTNGDFSVDSNWTKLIGWTISGGSANCALGGTDIFQSKPAGFWNGKTLKVTYTVSNYVQGEVRPAFWNPGITEGTYVSANGTYTEYISPTTDAGQFGFRTNLSNFIGSIDNVSVKEVISATNTPRIDYSTGAEAFLLEPQSTNLIPYSEDFSQLWSADDATLISNSVVSPDGTQNASTLIGSTVNSRHNISRGSSGSVDASFSLFVKAKELKYLQIASANTTNQYVNFDIESGIIGNVGSSFSNAKIENYSNGWYRVSVVSLNQYNSYYISLVSGLNAGWLESWVMPNNTDGLYIYGAQLEQQSYATSYIPTDGASATRNQELCNNATPVINSEEGTLYAEISALANDGTYRALTISDGTNSNVVRIYYASATNRLTIEVRSSNVNVFSKNYTLTDSTQFNKIAVKYKQNDFSLWVNGIEVGTDSVGNAPISLSELSFNNGVGTEPFFGNTKGLKYYPKALADVQLEDLTTI